MAELLQSKSLLVINGRGDIGVIGRGVITSSDQVAMMRHLAHIARISPELAVLSIAAAHDDPVDYAKHVRSSNIQEITAF